MKTIAYIACSLDGFIARADGSIDWLTNIPNPKNEDSGFASFLDSIDAVLMGRNTFETVEKFDEWPYKKKVFVLSNTLQELDSKYKEKAEIIKGNLKDILGDLESRGVAKLYVDGGKTIQSLLKEDLLDEMIITTISIVLGNGISLLGNIGKEIEFELNKSERLNEYMVKNQYKRRNRTTIST